MCCVQYTPPRPLGHTPTLFFRVSMPPMGRPKFEIPQFLLIKCKEERGETLGTLWRISTRRRHKTELRKEGLGRGTFFPFRLLRTDSLGRPTFLFPLPYSHFLGPVTRRSRLEKKLLVYLVSHLVSSREFLVSRQTGRDRLVSRLVS